MVVIDFIWVSAKARATKKVVLAFSWLLNQIIGYRHASFAAAVTWSRRRSIEIKLIDEIKLVQLKFFSLPPGLNLVRLDDWDALNEKNYRKIVSAIYWEASEKELIKMGINEWKKFCSSHELQYLLLIHFCIAVQQKTFFLQTLIFYPFFFLALSWFSVLKLLWQVTPKKKQNKID